ncbi:hypothetical protein Q5692_24915 [Microcoleus sp. C2C3]|uniref:hypothetical protein n=1 Tax=unclassified Microcoleus TaxID=2642155 RepID=UPI002FD7712D
MSHFKKAKPIDAMKHFALFLLALILSGVMALSHRSAGATAPSDIGITRATELKAAEIDGIRFESIMPEPVLTLPKKQPDTNGVIAFGHVPRLLAGAVDSELGRATELTSFESTHSNAVEVDGIHLETVVFNPIWRIPANLHGANTPVQFGVRITNKTSESIRVPLALSLGPKIVKMDGQELKIVNQVISSDPPTLKKPLCPSIKPGKSETFVWNWILQWQNNQLQLEGTNAYGAPWIYEPLSPGVYSIALEYDVRSTIVQLCELITKVPRTEEKIWVGRGTTPSKNIRLVHL